MKPSKTIQKTVATLLLLLFAASTPPKAHADDVKIRSTYPLVYGEYANLSAQDIFKAGTPTSGALTNIYGDVNVLGDLVITKPDNCRVRVAPKMGPYGADAFQIQGDGNVAVSMLPVANIPRLKVSTVLIGGNFYAWGDPADSPSVVGIMHGFKDNTIIDHHLKRKAQFASRPAGSPTLDPALGAYAPLRMDGREIQFGIEYQLRTDDVWGGVLNTVLIGTRALWTPPVKSPQPEVFLQVGNPNETPIPATTDKVGSPMNPVIGDIPVSPPGGGSSGFRIFSSRDYKKDIFPLTPAECGAALDAITRLDVVKYRFKSEPKSTPLHTGVIAEDLPAAIQSANGKSLNLAEAYAYAAAALKALKIENDALKIRLAALESKAAEKRAHR